MQNFSTSPREILSSILRNRALIFALIQREVTGRYRGSFFGIIWSFFNPLLMLSIYTFVFSVIFKARWNVGSDSKTEFALVLFAGLLVFNLFSECVNKAPTLITSNANYVKKVVFPLEILPVVSFGAAFFHMVIGFLVWMLFYIFFFGTLHFTVLLFPIVLIPLVFMTLGLSWILASFGVYLRDLSQIMSTLTMVLMFVSPVFFPISTLPLIYQKYLLLNPLTPAIEQARDVLIWGVNPNWNLWALELIISMAVFYLGFVWFQKTRKGFSDVL